MMTPDASVSENQPHGGQRRGLVSQWPWLTRAAMLLSVGVLLAGWWHALAEMWLRWFPAWEKFSQYPLMDRLSKGDSYYSHGPLVPLTSLILAVVIYRRVGWPARFSRSSWWIGWGMFAWAVLLQLASALANHVTFVSGFALIGLLFSLLLILGGWPVLKAYAVPVGLLFFMVPLPLEWIASLNFQLKSIASSQAVWITDRLLGIACVKDGSYVFLPLAADGSSKMLVVENVCSGLRSLISLTFFASLFALICRVKGAWRLAMLFLSVPVAIFCNIIRITSLNVVAHHFGVAAAGPDSWFHGFSGMMVFGLALLILMTAEQLIVWIAQRWHLDWVDSRLMGYLDRLHRETPCGSPRRSRAPMVILLTLTMVAAVSWQLSRRESLINVSQVAAGAVPAEVTIQGEIYRGQNLTLDELTLTILETNDYLYRRYQPPLAASPPRRGFVDFVVIFSPNNRKGTHPPEVCLEGGGERVISKQRLDIALAGSSPTRMIPMRELVTQKESRLSYHLYVYKCGDRYTTDFFTQQAMIFANGLLRRNTAGALIRLTIPVIGQDVESARQQALDAAEPLLSQVADRLP